MRSAHFFVIMLLMPIAYTAVAQAELWRSLPALPDSLGLAGAFVGTIDETLIVAGGTNFPERSVFAGGRKVWHTDVYRLSTPKGPWERVGALPKALAHGVSVSTERGLLCLGGIDSLQQISSQAVLLTLEHDTLAVASLPDLPFPVAYACGALVGKTVYLAGGVTTDTLTQSVFLSLDLSQPATALTWQQLPSWPGPDRAYAVAGAYQNTFLLAGGRLDTDEGEQHRTYLTDAYCYSASAGWERLPDVPRPVAHAPALVMHDWWWIFGGVEGRLTRQEALALEENHPGWATNILAFDLRDNTWEVAGPTLKTPLHFSTEYWSPINTTAVRWQNCIVVSSGEVRPGVRTPLVYSFNPSSLIPNHE